MVLSDLAASMIQDSNKQNALTHLNLAWCTIQEITNNSAGKRCTRMREVDEGVAHPGMFQVKKNTMLENKTMRASISQKCTNSLVI